jgi:decaprenyl-phosphate phosphoribosyltransferase
MATFRSRRNNVSKQRVDASSAHGLTVDSPASPTKRLAVHIAALRPRQWTKNLVVFAAPLFGFDLSLTTLLLGCFAFTLFCCTSSSFYLINDILDVESDRQHPKKCKRPIASGSVTIPVATTMAVLLLAGSLAAAWKHSIGLGLVITGYALLQIAYNLRLKRTVVLDVLAIAAGFVLRAAAGAAATHIVVSSWFLLCTAMLALFLAVEKRKAELRMAEVKGGTTRAVLHRYSATLLGRMENTVTAGAITAYALWSAGPKVGGASTSWMMLTLPFVVYGIFRYQLLSDPQEIKRRSSCGDLAGQTERPEDVLLRDRPILLTVVGWVTLSFLILLLKHSNIIV